MLHHGMFHPFKVAIDLLPQHLVVRVETQRLFQSAAGFFVMAMANQITAPALLGDRLPLSNFEVIG